MFLKNYLSIFVISCLMFESNASYGIGPITKSCVSGDIHCIADSNLRASISCLADGIYELGISGLDPIILLNVTMDQGFFKLVFPITKIFGSRYCKVVTTNTDVLQSTSSVTIECPVQAVGKYILSAKSFIFDINNEGNFVLQSDSIRTTITSKFETIYGNDGKQYRNLLGYEYFYEPLEKIHVDLENLFSGDIERGQFFLNFMPNNLLVSIAKIAEPLVDTAVANFHEVFKAALLRLPIN